MRSQLILLVVLVGWLSSVAIAQTKTKPEDLRVVAVLGNTSGMSTRPVPYAFYTGIGLDSRGRLYLAGAAEGIPVCDQDGDCLAVLALPKAEALASQSLVCRAGDFLFLVATNSQRSKLYRLDTRSTDPAATDVRLIAEGPGHWAVSPTLDAQGRVLVGQSDVAKRVYRVTAFTPDSGTFQALFELPMPKGAMAPWRHTLQVDPDGMVSITHLGGVNWSGRYSARGQRTGEAIAGQILDGHRYHFNYEGGLRRTDLDGNPAPGECGSPAPEIRMAAQLVRWQDRYFFAGRDGALEAEWNGTNFVYRRRIGGIHLEDLVTTELALPSVAFTAQGNQDVQHPLQLPKTQPIGPLLLAGSPLHGKHVLALAVAPEGMVYLYRDGQGAGVFYLGAEHLKFDIRLPQVREVGQVAVLDQDLLVADPKAGTIWRRPLMDKRATVTPWRSDLPGVIGLAAAGDVVYAATATRVYRLSRDGRTTEWTSPETYRSIRRLAAVPEAVYVCDSVGHIVDQLDARTGQVRARLGIPGESGAALDHLAGPHAVAADLNGVYVADNGNGRVVVATTTLWRPEVVRLPRQRREPIVAARIPVQVPKPGRLSVNVYDSNDLTVRQLIAAGLSDEPVLWDGRDDLGRWAKPGTYRYHAILAPKFGLRYVTSIGQSGRPPYRTADGKGSWGGVWGNVMDICTVGDDPQADILVLWAFEEGEGGLIRMSQDGEVRWKQHLDWWMEGNQMAVACDGPFAYVACSSALGSGGDKSVPFWQQPQRPLLWRVDAKTGDKRPLPGTDLQKQRMFGEYVQGREDVVTDVAVRGGRVYLTAPAQNRLFVADADTGEQRSAWALEGVSGVTFDSEGRLLVGRGAQIVRLDENGGVERVVAEAGGRVWDVDALPGGGLVASVGAPRHQVLVFDREGKEVRALGKRGGRPLAGPWNPDSFLKPVGLCATAAGRLFIAENSTPKRFSRWSPEGKRERDFHGPYYFSGMFGVDDCHPEHIYADTHADLIRYKLDYETGRWDVDHYWIDAYQQSGVPLKWWPTIRHKDGKTYWCSGSGGLGELTEDRVRGVAAVYGGWVQRLPDGGWEPVSHTKKTAWKGTWSDLNSDGRKQPEEWQVTDRPAYPITGDGPQQGWGAYFDDQFNLFMHDWSDAEAAGVWKVPVSEWRGGVPIYRWQDAQHAGLNRFTGIGRGSHGARTAFAAGGAVYGFNGAYNDANLPGVGHGHDWRFAQITKYDEATGKPLWHAGRRTSGFAAPGEHYCPTGAAGILGDYLFWTDENSLVHVWDVEHGLYVDTLLEDISRDPRPSPYTVWVELFNTRVFRHPKTGKVYLMAGSDAIHVFEVLGADQRPIRLQGEFQLTAVALEAAQREWEARARPDSPRRALAIPRAKGPVRIDGDLSEFRDAPAAAMVLRPGARAEARLLHDDRCLYLAFDVQDDSP